MRSEDARPVRLADYQPPAFLIDTVELGIDLDRHRTRVRSVLRVRANPERQAPAALELDGDELKLLSVKLDGRPLPADAHEATAQKLTILQPPAESFTLEIETELDPSANTKLMGLYRSGSAYCTQCEAEGFRRITYFPDRPDVMAVYTVTLTADRDDAPVLLANGNLQQKGEIPETNRHFAVWHDPHPKPSYLFAVVGGNLDRLSDSFTTMSGRKVELGIYVEPGKAGRATYAMDALKRSMVWDEKVFGREYDLDVFNIVAVSDFNMGAMENKGLNVFNDKYVLASPETATDADYAGIESVIAHEYFHNWTGNRITCRDWFQLCLKEGLTVFRDQEFSSDERSRPVKRIADVRTLRSHQFPEDSGPLAHPVRPDTYREINNFYTATIYEKGAEIIRMLKTLIGADLFAKGMDLYFDRHDGQATTIEAFIACFADVSKQDLSQFMLWYAQAGTPEVQVQTRYDAEAKTLHLDVAQKVPATPGQPTKKPMVVPLAFGLLDQDGRDLPIRLADDGWAENGVIVLDQEQKGFTCTGVSARPVLSVNRGFSAPIRLIADITEDDLFFLARHDSDFFNRWEALQKVTLRELVKSVDAIRAGETPATDPRLISAFASSLEDQSLEHAFAAQLLTLPSEVELTLEIGRDIDPDAVHAALLSLRQEIGAGIAAQALERYRSLQDSGPFVPGAASAGRRSLRAVLLGLLTASHGKEAAELAATHYRSATNMTDRISGLAALSRIPGTEREEVLKDFRARYRNDALVMDKWLSIQAAIPEEDALDRVKRLMKEPDFSLSNPNRVRALIGSFAGGNPTQFHRADGTGYQFLVRIIDELDAKNPQVAARLLTAFRSWRTLEAGRRARAEAALKQLAGGGNRSSDVADILTRTLG
ncbi:aminopeptidase N [Agaricicola taiwanensis]|uniref:Aminopeptidase N n=1 Tax=Agaricicola taiwanensis TaxID=591372 RepID=A0A8J2YEK8_9RHOB|nr:aminopeptidase N [Agaricicola taiwanensis]GGE37163.1 aminopeptidase N [Agaricicola taiwanensis]